MQVASEIGIIFEAASTDHVFRNAEVRYATTCIKTSSTSGLTIDDSSIHDCYRNGIQVVGTSASLTFKGSTQATSGTARGETPRTSTTALVRTTQS